MELITILSTIILIATISTFMLAVGAYILYKIRDRREQKPVYSEVKPTKAELITVSEQSEWEDLKRKSGKPNLGRVKMFDDFEIDKEAHEKRAAQKAEAPKQDKAKLKFVKYTSERYPTSNTESGSGELLWK